MKRSFIITLTLIAAIAVPLCASSGWARGLGVLGLCGASGSTPSWTIEDDFETNTASNYTAGDGYITVSSGKAHGQEWSNSRVYHNTDLSTSNNTGIGDIVYDGGNDSAGVGCRMSGAGGYQAYFYGGELKLTHSYSFTKIGSYSGSYGAGTYSVQIKCNGSTISVEVGGVERISVSDTTYATGTKVGMVFRRGGNYDSTVDNFKGADL